MMSEVRARSYLLTGNNPEKLLDDVEIDYKTATEQDYRDVLDKLVDRWVKGDVRHNDRRPEVNGVAATWELGDTGNHHVHVWICSKSPIPISSIRERFPKFHIDVIKAKDVSEVEGYIWKTGKHLDKKHTQIVEPVTFGEYFCTNSSKGNTLAQDLEEYVKLGMKPRQIILSDPRFAMHEQMVHAYYGAFAQSRIKPIRDVRVTYRTGEVGSGKSYTYVRLCEEYGEENVYLVSADSTTHGSFDEYASERILVIDELRPDSYSLSQLLGMLDGYKRQMPARYKNVFAAWEQVEIATVIPPEDLFRGMKRGGKADTFEQLRRRLDTVVYHYKDSRYEGADAYRSVSVKAENYEGIEQLRRMAEHERACPAEPLVFKEVEHGEERAATR